MSRTSARRAASTARSAPYARLYGPPQLAPRPERTGVVVLAWALWVLNAASLAWLTFLVAMIALWGAAEGRRPTVSC